MSWVRVSDGTLQKSSEKKNICKDAYFPFMRMVTVGTEDADKHDMKIQIQN